MMNLLGTRNVQNNSERMACHDSGHREMRGLGLRGGRLEPKNRP